MIDREFEERQCFAYCRHCDEVVEGDITKSVVTLPKSLIVVVDKFDDFGSLKNLVSNYPERIDVEEQDYLLSGFISQDPIYLDYNVSLKEEGGDHWVSFSKRGILKSKRITSDNVQMFMYSKVE